MKVNRREFIAGSAVGAALSTLAPVASARQATRTLSITFHGLAIFAFGRPNSQTGMPAQTRRVDVLFVPHVDHLGARLFGGPSPLDVDGGDLQIWLGNTQLSPSPAEVSVGLPALPTTPTDVQLQSAPADVCPINGLEWENLRRIPEFERILKTQVTVKAACLRRSPTGIAARFTMRSGVFSGDSPRQAYNGEAWKFPGGDINYIRAFTDTALWTVPLPDKTAVTARVVKFGSSTPVASVNLGSSGDIELFLRSGLKSTVTPPVDPATIAHFSHYYPLLDYTSAKTPKPTPLPTKVKDLCQEAPLLTDSQLRRQRMFAQFVTNAPQDECGATDETLLRGEPGICENGIAYADFE